MEFNATPVGNLPSLPAQQNDPQLMAQVMQDAQATQMQMRQPMPPNMNVPLNSYQPPPPAQLITDGPMMSSLVPNFNLETIVEQFKGPIIAAVIFLVMNTDGMQHFLRQNMPDTFLTIDGNETKQLLVKAGLVAVAFFVVKQFLFTNK